MGYPYPNFRLRALNPKPKTPDPKPQTLNPKPYTLNLGKRSQRRSAAGSQSSSPSPECGEGEGHPCLRKDGALGV